MRTVRRHPSTRIPAQRAQQLLQSTQILQVMIAYVRIHFQWGEDNMTLFLSPTTSPIIPDFAAKGSPAIYSVDQFLAWLSEILSNPRYRRLGHQRKMTMEIPLLPIHRHHPPKALLPNPGRLKQSPRQIKDPSRSPGRCEERLSTE